MFLSKPRSSSLVQLRQKFILCYFMAGLVLGAAADTEESWLRTARRTLERGLLHVNTVTPLITPHNSYLQPESPWP